MPEFDNRNRFTLFRNKRKEKPEHADFNGTFTDEDGNEYYMDAWSKTPKGNPEGEKFLSGLVKLKKKQGETVTKVSQTRVMSDDIPFAPEFR